VRSSWFVLISELRGFTSNELLLSDEVVGAAVASAATNCSFPYHLNLQQNEVILQSMAQRITFTETSYGHYIPVVVTSSGGAETIRELTTADLTQFPVCEDPSLPKKKQN
jgi:hypothetical protein